MQIITASEIEERKANPTKYLKEYEKMKVLQMLYRLHRLRMDLRKEIRNALKRLDEKK